MGKWAWRAIEGGEALWLDIIKGSIGWGGGSVRSGKDLLKPGQRVRGWWGEALKCCSDSKGGWFEESISRYVGNGASTSFWEDCWAGDKTLREQFPRLFELCLDKSCSVQSAGEWVEGRWEWKVGWRRAFREWEYDLINNLVQVLNCRKLVVDEADRWCWKLEKSGSFSVKSGYTELLQRRLEISSETNDICKLIWQNLAVIKVKATAWRIIFRRIATRSELRKRGVIQTNIGIACPLCDEADETNKHLFVECKRAWDLWSGCLKWLGIEAVLPNKVHENFLAFSSLVEGKKERTVLASVWVCTVWLIWKHRNEVVFNNGTWKTDRMLGEIKSRVWSWVEGAKADRKQLLSFGLWNSNPLKCCSSV